MFDVDSGAKEMGAFYRLGRVVREIEDGPADFDQAVTEFKVLNEDIRKTFIGYASALQNCLSETHLAETKILTLVLKEVYELEAPHHCNRHGHIRQLRMSLYRKMGLFL